jgi:hypothetical protein
MFKRFGVLAAGIGVVYTVSMVNRAVNYTETPAKVKSVTVDCYVEDGDSKIVKKGSKDRAYMDCAMAPIAAAQFGYKDRHIKKRQTVTFTYSSPVDKAAHDGKHEVNDSDTIYKPGQTIEIYAHTSSADSYRWN